VANPNLKNAGVATRFRPGQSGNPSGRSRESARIKELARKDAPEARERLRHWMRGNNPRVSIEASKAILDGAYGKPLQGVEPHVCSRSRQQQFVAVRPRPFLRAWQDSAPIGRQSFGIQMWFVKKPGPTLASRRLDRTSTYAIEKLRERDPRSQGRLR
jgi:hypothetical protein